MFQGFQIHLKIYPTNLINNQIKFILLITIIKDCDNNQCNWMNRVLVFGSKFLYEPMSQFDTNSSWAIILKLSLLLLIIKRYRVRGKKFGWCLLCMELSYTCINDKILLFYFYLSLYLFTGRGLTDVLGWIFHFNFMY